MSKATQAAPDLLDSPVDHQGAGSGGVPAKAGAGQSVTRLPPPAAPSGGSDIMSMMAMMERIAKNKEVDVTKMREVKEMGMSLLADQRRAAFDDALAQMQGELPTIDRKGRIVIRAKNDKGDRVGAVQQSSGYARWEDINEAIRPILRANGFALRFETGLAEDGRVRVTGILSGHGHREMSEFVLQHDSTGSKNAVQAVGSSTSYGKRYAACALLNITTRGEDDDGKVGGGKPLVADDGFPGDKAVYVNSAQITALIDKCKQKGCPNDRFLEFAKVAVFEEIAAADFDRYMADLDTYGPKK